MEFDRFQEEMDGDFNQYLMLNLEKVEHNIEYSSRPLPASQDEGAGQGREKGFNIGRNNPNKGARELE